MALGLNVAGDAPRADSASAGSRGRPAGGYRLADGSRVPSVTTILGEFKNAGALMAWAWKQGTLGLDFRDVRDEAAAIGTIVHGMIEADIRGEHFVKMFVEREKLIPATRAFDGYRAWRRTCNLTFLHTEVSLVSERHRYGGTFDAIALNGENILADWKSSRGVYVDFIVQLTAYKHLWEEHHPNRPISSIGIGHADKETGTFRFIQFSGETLDNGWRAFLILRELYDVKKQLEKDLKGAILQAHNEQE